MTALTDLTDLELLTHYARLCAEVETACEHGMPEEWERERRAERDRIGVAILSRMAYPRFGPMQGRA